MPSQLATAVVDQDAFCSFVGSLVRDFLPALALAAGLMAVIWVACAAIVIAGYLVSGVVAFGIRALLRVCVRYVRRQRDVEYAQPVTVDADGAHTKVVNLDRYRRRRQHRRSGRLKSDGTLQPRRNDDPA